MPIVCDFRKRDRDFNKLDSEKRDSRTGERKVEGAEERCVVCARFGRPTLVFPLRTGEPFSKVAVGVFCRWCFLPLHTIPPKCKRRVVFFHCFHCFRCCELIVSYFSPQFYLNDWQVFKIWKRCNKFSFFVFPFDTLCLIFTLFFLFSLFFHLLLQLLLSKQWATNEKNKKDNRWQIASTQCSCTCIL